MGKSSAGEIARRLIECGLPGHTPVAMVESASLPGERRFHTRLDLLPLAAATALGDGPAVLLIGQAVGAIGPVAQHGATAAIGDERHRSIPTA